MALQLLPRGAVGAMTLPDSTFAATVKLETRHVGASTTSTTRPSNHNPGTAAAPWETIAYAISRAQPGWTIQIHGGVYVEDDIKFNPSGTNDAPIRLTSAPGERVVIEGRSGRDRPFLRVENTRYWIVDGLEVNAAGQAGQAVRVINADHIVMQALTLHGGTAGAGVVMQNASHVSLLGGELYNFSRGAEDSHAVAIRSDCSAVLVSGVTAYGNSGDAVQLVGPDGGAGGTRPPQDVTLEKNRFHANGENAIDLKSCERVSVRANKMFGYRPKLTAKQGDALVIHQNARRVLIESNRIWDCGRGMSLGASNGTVGDVVIRRNLLFDIKRLRLGDYTTPGDAIRAGRVGTLEIYHNTLYNVAGAGIKLGDGGTISRCTVINNIVAEAEPILWVRPTQANIAAIDRNLYFNAPGHATYFDCDGRRQSFTGWVALGFDRTSFNNDPRFIDNPRYNDFYLKKGSPARDRAILLGEPFCFAGPDIGFLETCSPDP